MTLRQARCAWTVAVAKLILFAISEGYEIMMEEAMDRVTEKDPTTDHMKGSNHEIGLAVDLSLFLNGVWLSNSEDHSVLGAWWEEYGAAHGLPLVWGGNFKKPDGNHYSMRWQGRA